ncbi:MAG: Fe-S-containing hydro-lyase [Lachnospiraceae bacterium]|nr:Fe-S-containing hydro-lyase [Lachnospiraceae bacterium]
MEIKTPLTKEKVRELKAGDIVKITGYIFTARDAAHKRMTEAVQKGEKLPFDPEDQIIYYVGPTPAKPGEVIGSAGPTTSGRMDAYAPKMMELGLTGMIGKGKRSIDVKEAMKNYGAVYFAATGGAAALISSHIKEAEIIAYEDLGTEAVRRLYIEDFPAVVVIDSFGNDLYETEKLKYRG